MKMIFCEKNVYKYLLFLIVFLIPFSDKLNIINLGFIHVFAYRVVLIIAFIYLLLKTKVKFSYFIQTKWLSLFISFLIFYGFMSLLFVESKDLALKQLFYLFSAALTVIVFYSLLKNIEKPIYIIYRAWLFSFIIMAFFGILEILTNAHFISGYTTHLESYDFIRPSFNAPLVSYTNPNDFSIYLCISIVIFLFYYIENKNAISLISILIAYFLLYNTLSRFGLTAVYLTLICCFILISYRTKFEWIKKNYKKFVAYSFALVLIVIYMVVSNPIGKPVEKDGKVNIVEVPLTMQGLDFLFSTSSIPQDSTGSTAVRKNLIVNGLQFAWQSKGLGIGAGQFEYKMKTNQGKLFTNNISSPHHFVIEILSQYGLIALILLLLLFLSIIFSMYKLVMKNRTKAISNDFIFLSALIIIYTLTSNSASSYIPHSINWIVLTLIVFVFNEIRDIQISK